MKAIILTVTLLGTMVFVACGDNEANRSNRNSSDNVRQDNKNVVVNTNANSNARNVMVVNGNTNK